MKRRKDMIIKLDDKIKEHIKENIERDLKSMGCKNVDKFLYRYSDIIIEALEEAYITELDYLQDKIAYTNKK